jgi:Beta propeller domain
VGSKYVTSGSYWTARWYAPEVKTIVAVYRVSDPMKPTLERYNQIDGNYRDSRVIGDMLYLVSTSDLRLPPIYMTQYAKNANGFAQSISAVEKDFSLKNLVPEIRESYLGIKGKYISNIRASVASCKDVTFVLPDANTLKNMDFTPSFVSLSSLDTRDPTHRHHSISHLPYHRRVEDLRAHHTQSVELQAILLRARPLFIVMLYRTEAYPINIRLL